MTSLIDESSHAAGLWLLTDFSSNGLQNVNILFDQTTGAIFTGNESFGSSLDTNSGYSTSYTAFRLLSGAGTTTASDVPEPISLCLLGVGVIGIGAVRRYRTN